MSLRLNGEALKDIDGVLARMADADEPLSLCFDNHWSDHDSANPALLAAALMGSLANRHITVDVVDDDAADKLRRFGVATALWRRPDGLTSFSERAGMLNEATLGAIWTVGAQLSTDALFAESTSVPTGAFGPDHATFVNPHLSRGADGLPDILFLVGRWMYRRFEQHAQRDVLIGGCERVVSELVANVHEHAGERRHDVESLVRVAIDADAVHVTVTDTGIGICRSLKQKIPGTHTGERLLEELLQGRLGRWRHGRGVGLGRVLDATHRMRGALSISTGDVRASIVDGRPPALSTGAFALQGTLVDVMLPMPQISEG